MQQRAVPLGFQNIASLAAATGLILPVGAQQASGSSCSLLGKQLTVGGSVTGSFAIGQVVQGSGIPANTYITQQGTPGTNTWWLSNSATTGSAIAVTAYQALRVDFAIIRCTGGASVNWRDDGGVPTGAEGGGVPMLDTDPPFEYTGDLAAIQFIEASGSTPTLQVSYYSLSG